ncbi:MAG: AAA family ATPase, partial [Candidatus Azambacteria bacterium]|nr:AAA family ATPase [Candidatus Azambacteria bacterium]
DIGNLMKKASDNLKSFNGKNEHALEITFNEEELDPSVIIQALIKDISGIENGVKRGLNELGQGTQRIIVASILKAYLDILVERKIHTENPVLILFEEPEIYLHPRLKRTLNATLEKIAEQDNHQVIITTHDPYFVFQNFEEKKKIVSFEKGEDGLTKPFSDNIIFGIEDELLFIFLYSKLEKIGKIKEIKIDSIDGVKDRIYIDNDNKKREGCNGLECIRHQIHHCGDNNNTFKCGVSKKEQVPKGKNYYTEEELSEAIKKMSEILGA